MKKTSLFWLNAALFPAAVMLTGFIVKTDVLIPAALLMFLAGTLASFAGYFIRFRFYTKEKQSGKGVYISELAAGFAAGGLLTGLGGLSLLIPSIYMFACYTLGTRVYEKGISRSASSVLAVISFVLDAVIGNTVNKNYGIPFLFLIIPMIIMSVMWLYLLNDMNISNMVRSRNYSEKYLPPKIRNFNFRITSVIAAVTVVIMATYKLVTAFLWNGVLHPVMEVIASVISRVEIHPDDLKPQPAPHQAAGASGTPEVNPYADILQLICKIFMAALIIFLLIILIRKGVFSKLFRSIILSIRNFVSPAERKVTVTSPDGYTDTIENIEDDTAFLVPLRERRKWNSEYKRFISMENGREKFRFGYSLVLSWIKIHRPVSSEGLTPREITEKSGTGEYTAEFTDRYYPVRYDDAQCSSDDISTAEKTLDRLRKLR